MKTSLDMAFEDLDKYTLEHEVNGVWLNTRRKYAVTGLYALPKAFIEPKDFMRDILKLNGGTMKASDLTSIMMDACPELTIRDVDELVAALHLEWVYPEKDGPMWYKR